ATTPFPSGGFTFALYGDPVRSWNGVTFDTVRWYTISTPLPANYAHNASNLDFLARYLNQNGIPHHLYKSCLPTVNNEYQLPEKPSYLTYVCPRRGLPVTNVLDTTLPQPLGSGIRLCSGKLPRCGQPAQPGRIEHLYVAD